MIETEFNCVYCGALNVTSVDSSGGSHQEYIEDCQFCCKPNSLDVEIDSRSQEAFVTANASSN